MFNSNRYKTKGVQAEIPPELQLFMWELIDNMPSPKDYLQVFKLSINRGKQHISHESEDPEYHQEYDIRIDKPVTIKVYVIDDRGYCTMLLAEEY